MSSAGTRDADGLQQAARVREFRLRLGLSQEQLAARLGVSPVTVSRWENGRSAMSAAAQRRLRQLEHPDPEGPPPLAGAPPAPASSFVGREAEITSLATLLAASRLVCLTGPGGAGKTRLALEALRRRPSDGTRVVFAGMDQLSDPALVDARVAATLGIRDRPGVPAIAAITETLTAEPTLLVLDGAEHVLSGVAGLVQRVLAGAATARVLVTSRSVLDVPGEQVWPVPVLSCPAQDASPGDVAGSDAVRLFAARAAERVPGFAVTSEIARPLAELCRRLDGLPLAIELAASWAGTLSVGEILDYRLDLRASTMRAVAESSHALLAPAEQAVLADLSVFAGLFTLTDAAAITGVPPGELLHSLRRLVNSSWVAARHTRGQSVYQLLDTLREYAAGRLADAGGGQPARRRHAQHFAALAQASERSLAGPDRARWTMLLERATADLDAALTWARDGGDVQLGLEMSAALSLWWLTSGRTAEGRRWLGIFTSLAGTREDFAAAQAWCAAAVLANENGDYRAAIEYASRALRMFNALGAAGPATRAATVLGGAHRYLGDHEAAGRYFDLAVRHWRSAKDEARTAMALNNQALNALDTSDYSRAQQLLEESLALKRKLGNTRSVALALVNLADVYVKVGQTDRAADVLAEAEALNAEIHEFWLTGLIVCNLGDVARARSDLASAAKHYRRALEVFRACGNLHDAVLALCGLGVTLHRQGHTAKGTSLLREAQNLMASTGNSNQMPVVRAALAEIGQTAQAHLPDGLTSRQGEILGYVASGMTTKAIAQALTLSTGTVDRHIATIYRKLGLANRAQATGYAMRHGLLPPAQR